MLSVETIHCMAPPAISMGNVLVYGATYQPIVEQGLNTLRVHRQALSDQAILYYARLQETIALVKAVNAPLAEVEAKIALLPIQPAEEIKEFTLPDKTIYFLKKLCLYPGKKPDWWPQTPERLSNPYTPEKLHLAVSIINQAYSAWGNNPINLGREEHLKVINVEIERHQKSVPKTTELEDTTREFLRKYLPLLEGRKDWSNPYNKKELTTIQGLLHDFSAAKIDFGAQLQLQIQRTMQTYNTNVTLMSSLQSDCTELIKAVIREIR